MRFPRAAFIPVLIFLCSCQEDKPAPQPVVPGHSVSFTIESSGLIVVTADVDIYPGHAEANLQPKRLVLDTRDLHTCFFASEDDVTKLCQSVPGSKLQVVEEPDGHNFQACRFEPAVVRIGQSTVAMPVYARVFNMDMKPDYDGLLGMDFLSNFDVVIDHRNNTLRFIER
jgi:hypothetical protein